MSKNDEVVLQLQNKIAGKKAAMKASAKFTPVTNCSLELGGVRWNINVEDEKGLIFLASYLSALRMGAKEQGLELVIAGYPVDSWLADIRAKIAVKSRADEERKLSEMEKQLVQLLSEDKRTELELDRISRELLK